MKRAAPGEEAAGGGKRQQLQEEGGATDVIDLTTDSPPTAPSASSAAAAASASASEIVEIVDDEDEDEDDEYGDEYLGQIQSKIVGIQYYTGIVSRHEAVYLVREPTNRYDPNAIKVLNVSNEMVGHIPAVLAVLLAPIMDAYPESDFRVEGLVPAPDKNMYSMQLILNLRGSPRVKARVQAMLAQVPRIGKGHKVLSGSAAGGAGKNGAAAAGRVGPSVQDIMTKELERLYASSVPYEEMPEARTPRLLRSRLHPHQAKALHWMLQAERDIDVAQAIAEQKAAAAAEASAGGGAAAAAAAAAAEGGGGGAGGKGKGKKKAVVAGGGAGAAATVFFYEERVDPTSGQTVYYNIATDSATTTPPRLARGGLLCDDMGLGKTIEALALIAADVEQRAAAGGGVQGLGAQRAPTLVVCPLSVMANWEEQIREHLKGLEALETDSGDLIKVEEGAGTSKGKGKAKKGKGLRVAIYHGKERGALKLQALQTFDIVLSTYQVLARDFKSSTSSGGSGGKQRTLGSKRKGLLAIPWRRVLLDEAHAIKNRTSLTAQAAFALEAERRWCLTGTPISNRIEDLHALVKFLRVEPFCEFSWFQRLIVRPIQDRDAVGFQRLQLLVRHHALRRVKDMKVRVRGPDGAYVLRPLVSLPPKLAEVVPLELPPEEREVYDALHALARGLFSLAADGVGQQQQQRGNGGSYAHIFSILTRLRLLCLHPSLVPMELIEKVKRLHRTASSASGAGGTGAGAAAGMDPAAAMAKALGELGKEGVDKLLKALEAKTGAESEDCSICLEELGEDGIITRCLHVFHRGCLLQALTAKNPRAANDARAPAPCPNCRQPVSMADALAKAPPETKVEVEDDSEDEEGDKDDGGIKSSAKMAAVMGRVRDVLGKSKAEGNRVVLFSSFTSFLDLLGAMLSKEGIAYQRLDGSTSREKRAAITRAWGAASDDEDEDEDEDDELGGGVGGGGRKGKSGKGAAGLAQVLLVSIKAGGTGLNLTGANHCIICEPFFNPAVEDQAIDRVHRIGQTRPVHVTRFILSSTVEQALLRLQEQKRQLVAASFHQSREELRRLNYEMLRSVFDVEG